MMKFIEQIEAYKPINKQEEKEKKIILDFIDKYPKTVLTRDNEIAHLTSSGFIMNEALTHVLMIHHNIYRTWAWTGGHADGDMDLLEIAIKEAKEETGLNCVTPLSKTIASLDILTVENHIKREAYVPSHLHLNVAYVLIADMNDNLNVNDREASDIQWIKLSDIKEKSGEKHLIYIYNKLINFARDFNKNKSKSKN